MYPGADGGRILEGDRGDSPSHLCVSFDPRLSHLTRSPVRRRRKSPERHKAPGALPSATAISQSQPVVGITWN